MRVNKIGNCTPHKKLSPVAKGAMIAGGVTTAWAGAGALVMNQVAKSGGLTFKQFIRQTPFKNTKMYAACLAAALTIYTLIGAGIGKIVQTANNKKNSKD